MTPSLSRQMLDTELDYSILSWSGDAGEVQPGIVVLSRAEGGDLPPLHLHTVVAWAWGGGGGGTQARVWGCSGTDYTVTRYRLVGAGQQGWEAELQYPPTQARLTMLELSKSGRWLVATHLTGFILWSQVT